MLQTIFLEGVLIMAWSSMLKSMCRRNKHRSRMFRQRASFRPSLESLETRDMPSISFHAGVSIQAFSTFAVVGDFNNDGKIDIAVNESGTVGAYLGNGDGTFGDVIQSSNQIGSNVLEIGRAHV